MFGSYIYYPISYTMGQLRDAIATDRINAQIKLANGTFYCIIGRYTKNVVYCYGNACSMLGMLQRAKRYSDKNRVNIILFDYPGYGLTPGYPNEENNINALKDVIDQFMEVELIGESIGTGVALSYMKKFECFRVKRLYLINPFLSLIKLVSDNSIVDLFFNSLTSDRYENIWNIQFVTCPIEIYSLLNDEVIPGTSGNILFDRIRNGARTNKMRQITNLDYCHGNFGSLCIDYIKL